MACLTGGRGGAPVRALCSATSPRPIPYKTRAPPGAFRFYFFNGRRRQNRPTSANGAEPSPLPSLSTSRRSAAMPARCARGVEDLPATRSPGMTGDCAPLTHWRSPLRLPFRRGGRTCRTWGSSRPSQCPFLPPARERRAVGCAGCDGTATPSAGLPCDGASRSHGRGCVRRELWGTGGRIGLRASPRLGRSAPGCGWCSPPGGPEILRSIGAKLNGSKRTRPTKQGPFPTCNWVFQDPARLAQTRA